MSHSHHQLEVLSLVTPPCVAALTWKLMDSQAELLNDLQAPVEFLIGGDDLLPKLEQALTDKAIGETVFVKLEPADAFGDFDENKIFLEPRHLFPEHLDVGMHFEGLPSGCNEEADPELIYIVTDIYPEHVVLDGNHPLAGMSLQVEIEIHQIRAASSIEISNGTAGSGFFKIGNAAVSQESADPAHHQHHHGHTH